MQKAKWLKVAILSAAMGTLSVPVAAYAWGPWGGEMPWSGWQNRMPWSGYSGPMQGDSGPWSGYGGSLAR
jgi:hypothetical protein